MHGVCISLCLHVCMSSCLYVCMSLCLYACRSACLCVCVPVCLCVSLCVCGSSISKICKLVSLKFGSMMYNNKKYIPCQRWDHSVNSTVSYRELECLTFQDLSNWYLCYPFHRFEILKTWQATEFIKKYIPKIKKGEGELCVVLKTRISSFHHFWDGSLIQNHTNNPKT